MTLADNVEPPEVFKALSDPIRWTMIQQIAAVDELPCADLEDTLPVSKPTISYHTKILVQAGLIEVRKQGRYSFYTIRRDVLREVVDTMWSLAPEPRPVREGRIEASSVSGRRRSAARLKGAAVEPSKDREAVVLAW